jgi:hypothetical protein
MPAGDNSNPRASLSMERTDSKERPSSPPCLVLASGKPLWGKAEVAKATADVDLAPFVEENHLWSYVPPKTNGKNQGKASDPSLLNPQISDRQMSKSDSCYEQVPEVGDQDMLYHHRAQILFDHTMYGTSDQADSLEPFNEEFKLAKNHLFAPSIPSGKSNTWHHSVKAAPRESQDLQNDQANLRPSPLEFSPFKSTQSSQMLLAKIVPISPAIGNIGDGNDQAFDGSSL